MEAVDAQRLQQLGEVHSVEAGDTVHLTFGFRSDLTQYSDRVIRVHVVQEEASEEGELQRARCCRINSIDHAGSRTRPSSASVENEQFVDLEMQSGEGRAEGSSRHAWSYDIPVNSLMVAGISQCFRTMLTSGLHESKSKEEPVEVTLSPQEAHYFDILIHFAYTHRIPQEVWADKEALCWLLTVADRFEAPACIHKCVKALTSSPTTLNDAIMYLNLPETVKRHKALRVLMDAVSELTGWSFEEVAACESILTLEESSLTCLVSRLRDSDENVETLFSLILQWFRFGGQERWGALEKLLSLLGFWRMNISFLRNEVESCPELGLEEGRALVEKVKALKDPREVQVEAAGACQAAPAGPQAAAVVVAGAPAVAPAAPVGLDNGEKILIGLMCLGALVGFVLPFVFLIKAFQQGDKTIGWVLLALTTTGVLPYAGWVVGALIGKCVGLELS